MATAAQVVNRALSLILEQPSEAPIQGDEASTAIEVLNDMMNSWDSSGVSLGYTEVSNLGDTLTVPNYSLRAIKQNLAVELAPEFDAEASQLLFLNAQKSFDDLLNVSVRFRGSRFPGTLPIGSGNEDDLTFVDHFYDDEGDQLLTETDGTILLEEGTP